MHIFCHKCAQGGRTGAQCSRNSALNKQADSLLDVFLAIELIPESLVQLATWL